MTERISFVGAGGTGKTTLFNELRMDFAGQADVVFVEEAARQFFIDNPMPESDRFAYAAQERIQIMALAAEEEAAASRPRLMFCDRSVLDAAVYVTAYGDNEGGLALLKRVRSYAAGYSNIFLLDPSGIPFKNDQARKEDERTRQRLHETFLGFFEAHGIAYQLLGGSLTQRKEFVRARAA